MTTELSFNVGIDPSITGTAISFHGGPTLLVSSVPPMGRSLVERFKRYGLLVGKIMDILLPNTVGTSLIALEGYSYSSKGSAVLDLGEFGGLLRAELLRSYRQVVEVPPATVKQFVCGNGNAGKIEVVTACVKQWGCEFVSDDQYDAYVLGRIAGVLAGETECENAKQRKALEKLQGFK